MGKFSKEKRDIYYRRAKEKGYRARSAFKLLHINGTFDILQGVRRVVDLCAAPGGWSQVLSKHLLGNVEGTSDVKIVAVDLMTMAPIPGVITLVGDITRESTATKIVDLLGGAKAELVVCDGAPDVLGMHDIDEYIQHQLVLSALQITTNILQKGGSFVAKIFRGKEVGKIMQILGKFFKEVTMSKPKACRNSSMEGFVVCQKFCPPEGFKPSMKDDDNKLGRITQIESCDEKQRMAFKACGPHTWDSDQSYPLQPKNSQIKSSSNTGGYDVKKDSDAVEHLRPAARAKIGKKIMESKEESSSSISSSSNRRKYHPPRAPPIDPPYKEYLKLRKSNLLRKSNAKKTLHQDRSAKSRNEDLDNRDSRNAGKLD
mmetsp:Transcript_32561/g.52762  ORF Transcript_32561/g.52762 Transcript_32561/m.52762 type:complete len:372 (-) Transcript_32561:102-1217(-)